MIPEAGYHAPWWAVAVGLLISVGVIVTHFVLDFILHRRRERARRGSSRVRS